MIGQGDNADDIGYGTGIDEAADAVNPVI